MSTLLVDHNNKLGDNLMFNAVIREYCARYDTVGIFCMPRYHTSVSFMYRDLKNLRIELAATHRQKKNKLLLHRLGLWGRQYDAVKSIYADPEEGIMVERQLYAVAGVEFEKKWNGFKVERDRAREEALFAQVAPSAPYAFVHDDSIYKTAVDLSKAGSTLPVARVEKDLTDNVFDYCTLIERASEIHVVDSAFMFLVDCLPYDTPGQKLFVHRYARTNPPWNLPILKKDWTILT
ncbi:hypothetical protein EXS62_02915 [Candidatus Kaiserbacteria bacterium]|nr:hypothetical protein [Candidatus Kaiserbacteria bacterium]